MRRFYDDDEEAAAAQRASVRAYQRTALGKAAFKRARERYMASEKGKEARRRIMERYRKNPWVRVYDYVRGRCRPNCKKAAYNGIKNELTVGLIKILWERDKASEMRNPSIDRIDPAGSYTFDNCRFIELRENQRRPKKK